MSKSDPSEQISISFTRFPQNLLIPSIENLISFQVVNHFNTDAKFKFEFKSENLNVNVPKELEEEIHFGPSETKAFNINLTPLLDGYGALTFNASWLKRVKYIAKIKTVRDKVSSSKLKKILGKYSITFAKDKDDFNPNNYIFKLSSKEIKKLEKDLNLKMETNYISIEEIYQAMRTISGAYLYNKDITKALEFALKIPDENKKLTLYYNLLRAYASLDLQNTIEIIKNLYKDEKRIELIKNLALDQVRVDPEQAPRIAFLIEDNVQRENLITNIIGKIMESQPESALKISQVINNESLRVRILLNIIREIYKKNTIKANEIINQVINIIENSTELNLSENNFNNKNYQLYKDSIHILAELDSPQTVDKMLTSFNLREVKDKVSQELFDFVYEMVSETRYRFDPVLAFSQYYMFNCYVTNISEDIKNFSIVGGNISNNIVSKDYNFNTLFLSLFSYDFSIFPLVDQVYTDLKYNHKKSIAYYIFPSRENHNETETKVISNTLNQFGLVSILNKSNNNLIFNLDFIPYLGKPTIIISSNAAVAEKIQLKINKSLGNNVNIKIDNSLFKGGRTVEHMNQLFLPNKCEIVNLILSYELINNYEIFKQLILSLI